jgi:hypothetical protein
VGDAWRAALAPLRLALVRARARPGRWLPAAAGVAAAVALLGAVAGLGVLTADRAAERVLAGVPPERRTVTLTWAGGVPGDVDARARAVLGRLTAPAPGSTTGAGAPRPTRSVLRQPAELAGRAVRLAALTPLADWVRLDAGRLPRGCTALRCEVVHLGGSAAPRVLADRGVRVVVVGRGRLTSAVPLGFVPAPVRPGGPQGARAPVPLLAAADPAQLDALPGLRTIPRVQGWSAPLDLESLRAWELGAAVRRLQTEAAAAALRDRGLTAQAPLDALRAARDRAQAVPGRLVLVAAPAVAAAAAFLLLAAGGLRGGLASELDRLARRGATRGQRMLLAGTECAVPALAGTLAGAVGAAVIVAVAGAAAPAGAGPALTHGLLRADVLLGAAGGAAAALGLLAVGACAGQATARRLADLALAAAVAAGGALALRGPVRDGADPAAVVLPLVVAVVAGLAAGRLAPVLLGLAGRRAPAGGRAPVRLALLDLARRPAPAALAAGGLTVALAVAAFAVHARATLEEGARDQAAWAVPLDATVTPGPALEGPLSRAGLGHWRALPGVAQVVPVVRRDADAVQGPSRQPVTLLGVPGPELRALGGELGAAARRLPAGGPAAAVVRRAAVRRAGLRRRPPPSQPPPRSRRARAPSASAPAPAGTRCGSRWRSASPAAPPRPSSSGSPESGRGRSARRCPPGPAAAR